MIDYENYIDKEFEYVKDGKKITLIYNGYSDLFSIQCCICDKPLVKGHLFVNSEDEYLWAFGEECVHEVFGKSNI